MSPLLGELAGIRSVRLVARAKNSKTINEISRGRSLIGQVLRWVTGRPSVIGVSPSLCYCFWKSDPDTSGADLQVVFSPASYKNGFVGMLDDYPGMSCGVWQHRPESVGYVRAKSIDIFVDPAIQPNYLSHEVDQRALVGGIKFARRLLSTRNYRGSWTGRLFPATACAPTMRSCIGRVS